MIESWLYEKRAEGQVRCNVCALRCIIAPGHRGACGTRSNRDGTLYTLIHGVASTVFVDPIEKKPLFHFHPGTRVFSLGSVGCNFRCPGCQNWQISHAGLDRLGPDRIRIDPEEAAERALAEGCAGVAWTYNDPVIWIEQTVSGARRAKELGLYSCYVTNGYATPEHLELIGPHLTAWRVDLKGFSRSTYKKVSRVAAWEPVLEMTKLAKFRYGMHVECVTNITPTMNDDEQELREMARWIRKDLGEFTPWHVTRFFPYLDLSHLPPTPIEQLERVCDIGREEGLKYVYIGNVPGHRLESTYCHACGHLLIERRGHVVRVLGLEGGRCARCDAVIPGRWGAIRSMARPRVRAALFCG